MWLVINSHVTIRHGSNGLPPGCVPPSHLKTKTKSRVVSICRNTDSGQIAVHFIEGVLDAARLAEQVSVGGPADVFESMLTSAQQPSPQQKCLKSFVSSSGMTATIVLQVT